MAGYITVDSSHHRVEKNGLQSSCNQEPHDYGDRWYFSRKEIEEYSPSRRDGIDLKKETYLRKSYCTFLQDLGMRLQVPQVTIATAIVLCHRFFLCQSHARNDRRIIGTVCMFLAGKVEETPRLLKDIIFVSYEIIEKKGPFADQKIKHMEVYEQQKELILLGEKLVLTTLGFDLNVHHPYKTLVDAIKKFKVAGNSLAKVAWNFVNDGLRTSLSLQFKPQQIAAGAIFLAAKFLKVKLPSDGEKVWWQEFDVTPRQLEDVSNQLLEFYEQNQTTQPSQGNEANGSSCTGTNHHPTGPTTLAFDEISASVNNTWQEAQASPPMRPSRIQQSTENHSKHIGSLSTQSHSNDHGRSAGSKSGVRDHNADCKRKDGSYHKAQPVSCRLKSYTAGVKSSKHDRGTTAEIISAVKEAQKLQNDIAKNSESSASVNNYGQGDQVRPPMRPIRLQQFNEDHSKRFGSLSSHSNDHGRSVDSKSGVLDHNADCNEKDGSYHKDELVSCCWESSTAGVKSLKHDRRTTAEVISTVNKAKKFQNDTAKKNDLIEMEVEDGVELTMEDVKMRPEKREGRPNPIHRKQQPLLASMGRKPIKFGNGNADEQQPEDDGELTSLDQHDYSSRKLQSYSVEVSGATKRKPDEMRSDHSSRELKRVR